ncbi:MAG: hypothetical protein OPY08_02370 [Nitrosopumilus sp.]|nr:hypothetical protein [Nitrosopumilus sp.]MDF2425262.1 hypothetical protein [Nitrosopumilus sp.]MDF2426519.1 hypothetical protein [Nitrosopumilus sp.]MDF2430176.1 hypothetical protein [Nitrosopumilus sp.]
MNGTILKTKLAGDKRIFVWLIASLVGITVLYQLRPFLDDEQFMWISIPTYSIIPALLTFFALRVAIN